MGAITPVEIATTSAGGLKTLPAAAADKLADGDQDRRRCGHPDKEKVLHRPGQPGDFLLRDDDFGDVHDTAPMTPPCSESNHRPLSPWMRSMKASVMPM